MNVLETCLTHLCLASNEGGTVNSEDPERGVWSGSTLFA